MIQKIQFTILFFLFTLAAEFTKQFYIRNSDFFYWILLLLFFLPFDLHHESEQPALSQIEKRPDYSGLLGDDHTVTVALLVQARIQNKSMFGTCTDVTKSRATSCSALKFSDSHFTEKQAAVW